MNEYFKGPGDTEKICLSLDRHLQWVHRLYAAGCCRWHRPPLLERQPVTPTDHTYTIAQPLFVNLKQFSSIQFVKIYDQNGTTEKPDGASRFDPDLSRPGFRPSPTPTTTPSSSPTPTLTRTTTPTRTNRPTATPQYTLANVFFVDKKRLDCGAAHEVAGKRWVLTNNVPANVLTEFFKGPGSPRKTPMAGSPSTAEPPASASSM